MNLIDLSIRRPVFAWILMFALITFGAIGLNQMGISQLPDIDFPTVNISVAYEGASPEIVESELLDPIEERLLSIEGIKEMRSTASQGSGSVNLEFDINRNVDVVLQEVQTNLSRMRWPTGVDPAVVRKQNPDEDPIIIVSFYGDATLKELIVWTENYLMDQLRFLEGVGEVSLAGFPARNLRVWVDTNKLSANYLTLTDVMNALNTQHLESAAGQFTEGGRELRVRWLGEAAKTEDIGNIQILHRGGQRIQDKVIRIKDVATVEDGLADVRRIARIEGKQAVGVFVKKQRGTNEVEVANRVIEKLDSIKDSFPKDYNYRVNVDFTKPTDATVNLTIEKLWVAALITILICFLFLGNIQAAINILFSIPTSIVGTFIILYFAGFTLNLFTLLALTLSISIVVDDAIMLLENIIRHYRMGKPSYQAASDGAKEVLPAAIAATLAVIAVFLPVVFMDGITGKFFFQFGVTMTAAVSLSLLEAVTITPMRAAALLSNEPKVSKFEQYLDDKFEHYSELYQKVLKSTLNYKWSVLIGSMIFFAVSMLLIKEVRQEMIPAQDQNYIIMNGQLPPGTSLQVTSETAKKVEEILNATPEIEGFFLSIGGNNTNSFFMPVKLKDRDQRSRGHLEVMQELRTKFRDIKELRMGMRDISARNMTSGRMNPIAINLRGPDLNILDQKSQELIKRLEDEGLAVDLDSDYRKGIPELIITPNRDAMAARGVSVESVGMILGAGVGSARSGKFTADARRYDIRFKFLDSQIQKVDDFKRLYVRNNYGNLIPLSELVHIEEGSAIQSITRVNRQRAIAVFGNLGAGQSQSEVLAKATEYTKEILPTGYSFNLEGASAGFASSFESLYTAMMIGILVAYMILAVQFNSFVHPISVLVALPFSVTGALVALWMFDVSLNLFSFIGLIVLMGIAKKNSILLVEFTNQVREKGESDVSKALLEACPIRLRPILMTSVATVAAAAPLIFGGGIGSETRAPMGLTIVGGTVVSTLLTLFVVPALYLVLSKIESKKPKIEFK